MARACLTAIVVLMCTLLPFLPGSYDPLAVPLSAMSIAFGMVGLLMAPFGALALAARARGSDAWVQRMLARAAFFAAVVVWLATTLTAAIEAGWVLAALALGAGGYTLWKVRLDARLAPAALAIAIVPLPVAILQLTLLGSAVEFSRGRAMRNAAPLIADIEHYRGANGRYPSGLPSLWQDHRPGVVGVERYHYAPDGDSYNLYFEQVSNRLGTREIVVYNPRDDQTMASHDTDLLRPRPGQGSRPGGYYAVHDAPQPHWKYFWFD